MALNLNKNLKLYYSISEVAQMFGLNESTLRYWEQEFPSLRPKVSGPAKVRQYQEKDIEQESRCAGGSDWCSIRVTGIKKATGLSSVVQLLF